MNKNRINIRQPVDLNGPLKPLSTPLSLPPHLHLKWSLNCLKQTVSFQQVAEPHFFRLLKEKKKKEKKRYTDATYCGWQCCPPSAALNAPLLEPPSLTLTLSLTLSLSLNLFCIPTSTCFRDVHLVDSYTMCSFGSTMEKTYAPFFRPLMNRSPHCTTCPNKIPI